MRMYFYLYLSLHVVTHIHERILMYTHTYIYIYIHTYTHSIFVCFFYAFAHIYIYIHIYTYIHIQYYMIHIKRVNTCTFMSIWLYQVQPQQRRLHDHRVTAGCDRSGAAGTGPFALSALWLGHLPRKMAVLMGKSWEHHGKIHDQWWFIACYSETSSDEMGDLPASHVWLSDHVNHQHNPENSQRYI